MPDAMSVRQRQAARNQTLIREVNERVEEISKLHGVTLPLAEWICECVDETCTERLSLTLEEYELVRSAPIRFVVAPGHEDEQVERVALRTNRFVVVEKWGAGALVALRTDPRAKRETDT